MSQIVTLGVAGMHCDACERRPRTLLSRLEGVGAVQADHVTGRVRPRFDPCVVDGDALAIAAGERIERAGFTITAHSWPRSEGATS
jgi:copper chaperone CopZ